MTGDPLRFRKVDILRARGFEDGGFPVEDLSEGVNVIHGPNASGKTTMADAISSLLWPEQGLDQASIVGRFTLDGDDWRVDLAAGRAQYQREGQQASAPRLPSADQSDRYHLALHDLLQHETRNETFAKAILRESAGGYDVAQSASDLRFRDRPSGSNLKASNRADKALDAWNDAKKEVQELRSEERRLATLERQLEDTKAAKRRLDLIELAIDHAEARDALEDAQTKLNAMPEVLEDVSGDEIGTLEEVDEDISEWETKQSKATEKKANALEDIDEADLPDKGLPDELITELKEERDRVRELEGAVEELDRQIAAAEKRREEERAKIGEEVPEEKLDEIDAAAWGELSDFANDAEQVLADRHAHDELERVLKPDEEPEEDLEALRRGRQALEDWLTATTETPQPQETTPLLPILAILVVAGAAAALGVLASTTIFLAGTAIVAILAAAILYLQRSQAPTETPDVRTSHEQRVQQLEIQGPTQWTPEMVRKRLDEIHRAIAQHEITRLRREAWEAKASDLENLDEREEKIEQRREQLVERFGVAPDTNAVQLVNLADHVRRWQDANAELEAKRDKKVTAEGQLDNKLDGINEELTPHDYEPASNASQATAKIRDLEDRQSTFEDAQRSLQNAEGTLKEAEEKLDELKAEREAIFTELDLDVGDTERLRELCGMRDEYIDRESKRDTAKAVAEQEANQLEEHDAYEPHLKEASLADLKETKRGLEDEAAEHDDLLEEIKEIQADIKKAKKEHDVEDALAAKERALDELADVYASDCDRMVGHALADHVKKETTEANRGEVFETAREILATITKGRYRLDLDESEDGTFRAYDTVKERGLSLDELSSATRLQVLIAVRIAFVEQQESTARLPLLMDETLANTDDPKARAVIEAAIELARDGRQVFYFTAQGDEVAKWEQALADAEDVPSKVVDLAQHHDHEDSLEVPDLETLRVQAPDPPAPGSRDHRSYGGVLDVPPLNPRRGAGAAHLWYVVDDPDLLHHLLRLGLQRWGQLRTLLETSDARLVTDDADTVEHLRQTGQALEAFVEAWKRGRGKPVDRSVLEDADAVSDKFIDDVAQLAEAANGDAEAIIRGLRDKKVEGFWKSKMDELEAYFQEEGYIDPVDTLEPEEIRVRVMRRLLREGVDRESAADRADALLERITEPPEPSGGD